MPKCDHVEFAYKYSKKFRKVPNDFGYVRLAKSVVKKAKGKILFVLDYVPTEDLRNGRMLSGATGQLFDNVIKVAEQYYNSDHELADYSWLAVSYHAFKTAGQPDGFRADAKTEFTERLNHIITEYKPDTVVTFGQDPYKALNGEMIAQKYRDKRGIHYEHFYGVPIDTTVKSGEKEHSFRHVPTLSLNTLVNASGKGEPMYLAGYVGRNLMTALYGGELRYAIPELKYKVRLVDNIERFDAMMDTITEADVVAIDTETKNLNRITNRMLTIQFAVDGKAAYILPVGHKDSPWLPDELKYIKKKLRLFFERKNKNKEHIYANAVFDLNRIRVDLGVRHFKNAIWDVFAGEFGHDENMKVLESFGGTYYTLLNICMQYGCKAYYESDFGKDKRVTIETQDLDKSLLNYCALDVVTLIHIRRLQIQRAKDYGYKKYRSIVKEQISDMLHVFSCLEVNGCKTDINWLFFLKSKESPIIKHREDVLKALAETKGVQKANAKMSQKSGAPQIGLFGKTKLSIFDISKKDHLDFLMFDVLKLKAISTGKSGKGNIDKDFQKKYGDVPEVALYNELQKVKKIYNSYVKAFVKQWGSDPDMRSDSCIRPFFQFRDVVTGRTSAKKPSLHQIPSRNDITEFIKKMFPSRADLGKTIKRLFVAPEGRLILKIDYAAHEVRGWSIITGDQEVADLFWHGLRLRNQYKLFPTPELAKKIDIEGDVHKINAAYFFGMPIEDVDKPKRNSVKQVVFGLIYQQGMEGSAKSTGQTLEAIKALVKAFFKRFPVGAGWFDKIKDKAAKQLFVESPLGRRRNLWAFLIPKDAKSYDGVYAATGRRAVNSPIQGMGSDFLVSGARKIEEDKYAYYLKTKRYPDFYMTNSVHDSLEFSVAYKDVWLAIRMIEAGLTYGVMDVMIKRHGMTFPVPLEIDFEIGANIRDCAAWDYSVKSTDPTFKENVAGKKNKEKGDDSSIENLIYMALKQQKEEFGHDLDVEGTFKQIMQGQYEDMPDWAKKQAWNVGAKMKGMLVDPRAKEEVIDKKKAKTILEQLTAKPKPKQKSKKRAAA